MHNGLRCMLYDFVVRPVAFELRDWQKYGKSLKALFFITYSVSDMVLFSYSVQ